MITRRDLLVALLAGGATACAFALADRPQPMGSKVFDWNAVPAQATDTGSVRSFCRARTATLDELEIHATTLDPGKASHPPHRHPNEEVVIIKQGTLEAFENGEWQRVGPGSVIFSASNQLHGIRNIGTEPAVYHVVNFKSAATPAAPQP